MDKAKSTGKVNNHFTMMGVILLLMFLDAVLLGDKSNSFAKYALSILVVPLFTFLSGYNYSFEDYKKMTFLRWFIDVFLRNILAYVVAVVFYIFILNIRSIHSVGLNYFFKEVFVDLFKSVIFDSFFRLTLFLAITFYSAFAFMFSKFTKISSKMRNILFLGISSLVTVISLTTVISPSIYESTFGVIYVYIVEKNLLLYNIIFFALGVYFKSTTINIKYTKGLESWQNYAFLFLLIIGALSFFFIYNSDWYLDLVKNKKYGLMAIIKEIDLIFVYGFLVLFIYEIAKLFQKNISFDVWGLRNIGKCGMGFIFWYGLSIGLADLITNLSGESGKVGLYSFLAILFGIMISVGFGFLEGKNKINYYLLIESVLYKDEEVTEEKDEKDIWSIDF